MPTETDKFLQQIKQLSAEQLHHHNQQLRVKLAHTEWQMGASLLETQRRQLHEELGYSSVTEYAQKSLNLSPQKSMELLSTARALEELPHLEQAFRKGELSWGKVRELKRVATPETEKVWVDFARNNGVRQVQRKVAVSPTEWKRGQALEASLAGQPACTAEQVQEVLTPEPKLPGPKFITVVHHLTPDQYAVYQQAENRVRSRRSKRIRREEVLMELCSSELSRGTARARARHQVLVHTTDEGEHAWYETDRGVLPVSDEVKAEARVATSHGKSPGRKPIPNGVLRAVFSRAGNACERCGCQGRQLDVHHPKPVSDGGGNGVDELEVLCKPCHRLAHRQDYQQRPHWRSARQRNQREKIPDLVLKAGWETPPG